MAFSSKRFVLVAGICSAAVSLAACHITLVSTYDDTFDQELTSTQKDISALFSKVISNVENKDSNLTAARYSDDTTDIAKIRADISTLAVRAAAHTGDHVDSNNVADFAKMFGRFENGYQHPPDNTEYSVAHMQDEENKLNHALALMMSQELLKKQGEPATGSAQ